ncbi:hypothetical protein TNCV_1828641 [Trichonephila clavipes]|nr:hypothetical protein TNCV_1828641 [Trichonephila clavipes]
MKDFSTPVSQRAVMNVSFKRMGTYGKSTGVIRSENILIVRCSVSGGFSVHRYRSPPYSHRSLKSLNICFDHSDPRKNCSSNHLVDRLDCGIYDQIDHLGVDPRISDYPQHLDSQIY